MSIIDVLEALVNRDKKKKPISKLEGKGPILLPPQEASKVDLMASLQQHDIPNSTQMLNQLATMAKAGNEEAATILSKLTSSDQKGVDHKDASDFFKSFTKGLGKNK